MNDIVSALKWRYAPKQFDPAKKISDADLASLLEATRLSPSSFGLVSWKIIVVTDPAVRAKLREAGYGQPQFTDASHIVIFAAKTALSGADVDTYVSELAALRGTTNEALADFAGYVKNAVASRTPEARTQWAARQAYIALGTLIAAASTMHIDSGPMEGFDPVQFDAILGLEEKGLTAVVTCALGYRSDTDASALRPKYRPSKDDLVIRM
jgi:nitroreductase/dihydropteridine reductase